MNPASPASSGENAEISLLAEDNPAHSRVIFRETVIFRELRASRPGPSPAQRPAPAEPAKEPRTKSAPGISPQRNKCHLYDEYAGKGQESGESVGQEGRSRRRVPICPIKYV